MLNQPISVVQVIVINIGGLAMFQMTVFPGDKGGRHSKNPSSPAGGAKCSVVLQIALVERKFQPIRSTTKIWVETRHQYGISALVTQTSFCEGSSGETSAVFSS